MFCFNLISRREKLLRIEKGKCDHTDLTFFLQDNLLGLLQQLSISLWVYVYVWVTVMGGGRERESRTTFMNEKVLRWMLKNRF